MHGARAVAATAARVGYKQGEIWTALADVVKLPKAAADLDDWTDVRHRIVHRGEKPRTPRAQARRLVELVRSIALTIDVRARSRLR
jgi:hypothetical protein